MNKIRIAICDDSSYVVECIKMKLDDPEIEITGIASSAARCISMLKEANADILLLDIQMETETAGISVLPGIRSLFPNIKIVMLTGFDDKDYIFDAFSNGADNYVLKSFETDDLRAMVKTTYHNMSSLDTNIAKKLVEQIHTVSDRQDSILYLMTLLSNLSTAEFEVLSEIYEGATYKAIAKKRYVEESTIKTHAQRILKKTGVKRMKELIHILKRTQVFEFFSQQRLN